MITTASPRAWSRRGERHLVAEVAREADAAHARSAAASRGSAPTSGRASRRRRRRSPTRRPRRGAPPRDAGAAQGVALLVEHRHDDREHRRHQRDPSGGPIAPRRRDEDDGLGAPIGDHVRRVRNQRTTSIAETSSWSRPPRAQRIGRRVYRRELLRHRRLVLASQTTSGGLVLTGGVATDVLLDHSHDSGQVASPLTADRGLAPAAIARPSLPACHFRRGLDVDDQLAVRIGGGHRR